MNLFLKRLASAPDATSYDSKYILFLFRMCSNIHTAVVSYGTTLCGKYSEGCMFTLPNNAKIDFKINEATHELISATLY